MRSEWIKKVAAALLAALLLELDTVSVLVLDDGDKKNRGF